MSSSPMPRSRSAIVDALRGLAALLVFFHHLRTLFPVLDAQLMAAAPATHAAAQLVSARNTEAVLLFFVLSGFSIGLTVERRGVIDRAALHDYFSRRVLRVVPLYWLALGLSGAVAVWLAPVPPEALSLRTLLGNLAFLQTASGTPGQWFLPYAGNAALWSLSFEMCFYAAYPWLVRGVQGPAARALCVLGVCALGLAWHAVSPSPPALFAVASLIWYFGVELAQRHAHGRMGLHVAAYAALALVLGALRFALALPILHGLWIGAAFLLVGHAAQPREKPWPAPAWLVGLGGFSYGLYLLHVPILRACVALCGQTLAGVGLAVGASLLVAYAAERASRRLSAAVLE